MGTSAIFVILAIGVVVYVFIVPSTSTSGPKGPTGPTGPDCATSYCTSSNQSFQAQNVTSTLRYDFGPGGTGGYSSLYNAYGNILQVYYVPGVCNPSCSVTTLIVLMSSNSTQFHSVWTYGGNSPHGNFTKTLMIGTTPTWVILPVASCPHVDGYVFHVLLARGTTSTMPYGVQPTDGISFEFSCVANPAPISLTTQQPTIMTQLE